MFKNLAKAAALPQLPIKDKPRWEYLGYFVGALAVQFTWGLTAVATRFVQVSKQNSSGSCGTHLSHIKYFESAAVRSELQLTKPCQGDACGSDGKGSMWK